jgi:radical SAM protein (TIGR01212 family)
MSVEEQVRKGIAFASRRYRARKYIAYFQSFTNTYAPVETLRTLYDSALAHSGMVGLSVGTRPDCAGDEVLDLLASYQEKVLVWVEYGLQSAHDVTLTSINRGHDSACFARAVQRTAQRGLNVCAHIILGLPGESREMMRETARFLADLPVQGVKIHALYIIEGTAMARRFQEGAFRCLSREAYVDRVVDVLERLPEKVVIQRLTGDPPPGLKLLAPAWTLEKGRNLRRIQERFEERDTWQGREVPGASQRE